MYLKVKTQPEEEDAILFPKINIDLDAFVFPSLRILRQVNKL